MIFDDEGVWFRQSWLDDFLRDPRRAQFKLTHPELDVEGDAAACGTAVHSAAQDVLEGRIAAEQMPRAAVEHAQILVETRPIVWQKFETRQEMFGHAERCAKAFVKGILPKLPPGGLCEYKFRVALGEYRGIPYGITGTIDYVPPKVITSDFYDWKFPGRSYDQRDKQKAAIQPTVYGTALIHTGLRDGWPLKMHYGLGIRRMKEAKPEIITVMRTAAHEEWLHEIIHSAIDMHEDIGMERPWMAIESHFLCSRTWCPWWDLCRGKYFRDEDRWK